LFEASTVAHDTLAFFKGRLLLLENLYDAHEDVFEDLINHYNRSVLPALHPPENEDIEMDDGGVMHAAPIGLSQADIAFMENL
jgi:hypothetical protein